MEVRALHSPSLPPGCQIGMRPCGMWSCTHDWPVRITSVPDHAEADYFCSAAAHPTCVFPKLGQRLQTRERPGLHASFALLGSSTASPPRKMAPPTTKPYLHRFSLVPGTGMILDCGVYHGIRCRIDRVPVINASAGHPEPPISRKSGHGDFAWRLRTGDARRFDLDRSHHRTVDDGAGRGRVLSVAQYRICGDRWVRNCVDLDHCKVCRPRFA